MVAIPVIITAINSLTASNNIRLMNQRIKMREKEREKNNQNDNDIDISYWEYENLRNKTQEAQREAEEKREQAIPAILKHKFIKSWTSQNKRLSALKINLTDSWQYDTIQEYGFTTGRKEYHYENGDIARIDEWDGDDRSTTRYDERKNCIEDSFGRYTYYPDTNVLEFSYTKEGIKHFNKQGKEDTERYYAKLEMARKRIAEEQKTGKMLKKMTKVEKAVAYALRHKPQMTIAEKMLAHTCTQK